jgi:hypothetical protein
VVDVVVQRLALQLIEREAREPLGRGVHVRAPLVRVHDKRASVASSVTAPSLRAW